MEENIFDKSLDEIKTRKEENELKIKELDKTRKAYIYNSLETKTAILQC